MGAINFNFVGNSMIAPSTEHDLRYHPKRMNFRLLLVLVPVGCMELFISAILTVGFVSSLSIRTSSVVTPTLPMDPSSDGTIAVDSNVEIINPRDSFRETKPDELSVVSFNVLAPSYHCIGNSDDGTIQVDRTVRLPQSYAWAQTLNADVLLLQEVEEGTLHLPGYDYYWSLLRPHQEEDRVGLAVAWKTSKYSLVQSQSFSRGQIVQLQSLSNARIILANLHLFAKPSAILGRLKVMSSAVKRTQNLLSETLENGSALDGTVLIGGDLNCNDPSVTTNLIKNGKIKTRRRVKDRNYSHKLTKHSRSGLSHWLYPFTNIYDDRRDLTNITVSCSGRGPGCMDHLFFVSGKDVRKKSKAQKRRKHATLLNLSQSRRQSRRIRGRPLNVIASGDSNSETSFTPLLKALRVQSLLATMNSDDDRNRIIFGGLPNASKGFPSDHLPIGVLLGPEDSAYQEQQHSHMSKLVPKYRHSGLSQRAQARRDSHSRSLWVRSRHNAVVRAVCEWLIDSGAEQIVRDQPLRKWKWTHGVSSLRRKTRAPDICCVLTNTLLVVEVTVGPERLRQEKLRKYNDLAAQLRTSPAVTEENLCVAEVMVLVIEPDGTVPITTTAEVERLAALAGSSEVPVLYGKISSTIANFTAESSH